jgi:hypothetical protein
MRSALAISLLFTGGAGRVLQAARQVRIVRYKILRDIG